jgi:poly(3-hydroxybutyrate) depolymerase
MRRGYWLVRAPVARGPLLVVLYRIDGGGHGWPGGPQFLPARVIGPIPWQLDATGILLDMVCGVSDDGRAPSG